MSERRSDEKEEKLEKQDEKEEKSQEEKWRRDPLGAMVWAGILIWVGLVLLGQNLGIVPEGLDTLGLIFLGAGALILLEVLVRVLMPAYRRPLLGSVIVAIVFLAIGLGALFEELNQGILWAVLIIAIGVFLLLRGFVGRPKQ